MAIVDLDTGNITGCEKGSRVWCMRKDTLFLIKVRVVLRLIIGNIIFMMTAVLFGSLSLLINSLGLKVFTFMNALGMICSYIYEEVWCWAYSFRHYK